MTSIPAATRESSTCPEATPKVGCRWGDPALQPGRKQAEAKLQRIRDRGCRSGGQHSGKITFTCAAGAKPKFNAVHERFQLGGLEGQSTRRVRDAPLRPPSLQAKRQGGRGRSGSRRSGALKPRTVGFAASNPAAVEEAWERANEWLEQNHKGSLYAVKRMAPVCMARTARKHVI